MSPEDIARVCHQVNKAYCESQNDFSQNDWEQSPQWQRDSAINGVKAHIASGLLMNGIDSHQSWLKEKRENGWVYGEVKDAEKKTHPCMVPYHELPEFQRKKDSLFTAVVRILAKN